MKILYYLTLSFLLAGCFFKQFKMEFDRSNNSIKTCNDNQVIKSLEIREKGSRDLGYRIYLTEKSKGSSIVYLEKKNNGYQTSDGGVFELKPNMEYKVISVFLDSKAEIIIFTNQYSEVDSVINNFNCR